MSIKSHRGKILLEDKVRRAFWRGLNPFLTSHQTVMSPLIRIRREYHYTQLWRRRAKAKAKTLP